MAIAMEPGKNRDDEIDVDTDDGIAHGVVPQAILTEAGATQAGVQRAGGTQAAVTEVPAAPAGDPSIDDAIIEVGDDEIETADPALTRQTLPSPSSSFGSVRSRPPAPPSLRPRSSSSRSSAPPFSSALPPPSHLTGARLSAPPPSNSPSNGRAAGVDPWLLANKTLELSRAHSHIVALEEQLAYRDARIVELEEQLAKARRKLGDLEASPKRVVPSASPASSAPARLAISEPGHPQTALSASSLVERTAGATADGSSEDDGEEDFADDGDRESDYGQTPLESLGARVGNPEEDLQQITGIGPRFEAALRKQGITRLSQIAAWSDADVRQVAKALRIPKSRIVKGRWVEAAREAIGTGAASE